LKGPAPRPSKTEIGGSQRGRRAALATTLPGCLDQPLPYVGDPHRRRRGGQSWHENCAKTGAFFATHQRGRSAGLCQARWKWRACAWKKVWWIRQAITHALAAQGGVLTLPVKQLEKLRKVLEGYRRYTQQIGVEPSSEELAEELDLPPSEVETILHVYRHFSLDTPIGAEGETNFLDLLPATTSASGEETYINATLTQGIQELLSQLPPRQQLVLRLRFGLDGEPNTLEEIGGMLGLTRERVRQIERQAKDRLRQRAKMRALQEYLN
jgi:RNA polymerase sigma factor (sigma-70 family)